MICLRFVTGSTEWNEWRAAGECTGDRARTAGREGQRFGAPQWGAYLSLSVLVTTIKSQVFSGMENMKLTGVGGFCTSFLIFFFYCECCVDHAHFAGSNFICIKRKWFSHCLLLHKAQNSSIFILSFCKICKSMRHDNLCGALQVHSKGFVLTLISGQGHTEHRENQFYFPLF